MSQLPAAMREVIIGTAQPPLGFQPSILDFELCPACKGESKEHVDCLGCDGEGWHGCDCGDEHECHACKGTGERDGELHCTVCAGTGNVINRCFWSNVTMQIDGKERVRRVQFGCGGQGYVLVDGHLDDCPRCGGAVAVAS